MIKMAHEQQTVFENSNFVFLQIGEEIIINNHSLQTSVSAQ